MLRSRLVTSLTCSHLAFIQALLVEVVPKTLPKTSDPSALSGLPHFTPQLTQKAKSTKSNGGLDGSLRLWGTAAGLGPHGQGVGDSKHATLTLRSLLVLTL